MCIRDRVGCLRLGKLRFCFGNPIKQESDFLLDVPDNGIGCSDPAVELAFLGAYAFLLHCPDGCALMDGGKTVSYTHLDVYKRQPTSAPAVKQTSCLRVRLNMTLVSTLVKSLGTGT